MTDKKINDYQEKRNMLAARKVFTYAPMQDGREFLARVNGWPIDFRGKTAMQAVKRARAFIEVELKKLDAAEEKRLRMSRPSK